jgi:hypothetical protein
MISSFSTARPLGVIQREVVSLSAALLPKGMMVWIDARTKGRVPTTTACFDAHGRCDIQYGLTRFNCEGGRLDEVACGFAYVSYRSTRRRTVISGQTHRDDLTDQRRARLGSCRASGGGHHREREAAVAADLHPESRGRGRRSQADLRRVQARRWVMGDG